MREARREIEGVRVVRNVEEEGDEEVDKAESQGNQVINEDILALMLFIWHSSIVQHQKARRLVWDGGIAISYRISYASYPFYPISRALPQFRVQMPKMVSTSPDICIRALNHSNTSFVFLHLIRFIIMVSDNNLH